MGWLLPAQTYPSLSALERKQQQTSRNRTHQSFPSLLLSLSFWAAIWAGWTISVGDLHRLTVALEQREFDGISVSFTPDAGVFPVL